MQKMALYEVKNQLSRVIQNAENGEIIELTRHGKPAAIIIGVEQFTEMKSQKPNFKSSYRRFRDKWFTCSAEWEEDDFVNLFENIRDRSSGRKVDL